MFEELDRGKRIWPFEGSFAKCILDKMPGVGNDIAAHSIYMACMERYPDGLKTVESGSPLSFSSALECVASKGRDTVSPFAARAIYAACYHRYK